MTYNIVSSSAVSSGLVTSSGSNTARSLSSRFADAVNVLDFGADPTGVADSSTAFNSAASVAGVGGQKRRVYMPAGKYYLAHQVNAVNQTFEGDGRESTLIIIDQGFDPTATAIFSLTSGGQDPASELRNFSIRFTQPSDQSLRSNFLTLAGGGTSGLGGTGIQYPPAIKAVTASARYKVSGVRISAAWIGIDSFGLNCVWWLDNIEMSAFQYGLYMGGSKDFCHIHGYHFWDFDISSVTNLYSVYQDGSTYAAYFGEIDGLSVTDFTTFKGRILINSSSFWGTFTNLMLDGPAADLEIVSCGWVQILGVYGTGAGAGSNAKISVAAGVVTLSNGFFQVPGVNISVTGGTFVSDSVSMTNGGTTSTATSAQVTVSAGNVVLNAYQAAGFISVTGGTVLFAGGQFTPVTQATPILSASAGKTIIQSSTINPNTGLGAWSVPLITTTGSAAVILQNNFTGNTAGDAGWMSLTDNALNVVSGNSFGGWTYTVPGSLGTYQAVSGIRGVTNASNAAAGSVGEFITAFVGAGSPVSLTTATPLNVTSISLTAGDWDVSGTVGFSPAATTSITVSEGGIGTTSAIFNSFGTGGRFNQVTPAVVPNQIYGFTVAPIRVSISSTTTVYLIAMSTFTVSTNAAYGVINARRIR